VLQRVGGAVGQRDRHRVAAAGDDRDQLLDVVRVQPPVVDREQEDRVVAVQPVHPLERSLQGGRVAGVDHRGRGDCDGRPHLELPIQGVVEL
jgi:hypothetical protein